MLSEDVLQCIEENARLAFTDRQIAIITGIPWPAFKAMAEDDNDQVHLALAKGRLMAEAEVRESVFNMARSGSAQAQTMALEYIQRMKIDMLNDE